MSSQVVTLYEDKAKTNALYPRTKLSAISDDDGKALSETISELNTKTRINYLRPELQTQTKNGVTVTNNGDGTYTLNGTATDTIWTFIFGTITLNKGVYKGVGHPLSVDDSYWVQFITLDEKSCIGGSSDEMGNGTIITLNEKTTFKARIVVPSSTTLNNVIIKPMITDNLSATYDDFVSFDDSLVTGISSGLRARKMTVTSSTWAYGSVLYLGLHKSFHNIISIKINNGWATPALVTSDDPMWYAMIYRVDGSRVTSGTITLEVTSVYMGVES